MRGATHVERKIIFRVHAVQRIFERRIGEDVVRQAVLHGETSEEYPDDRPYPGSLVLGWAGNRPVHVVFADNPGDNEYLVITAYEPAPALWDPGFRRRRT
jgi:hypothetical protein